MHYMTEDDASTGSYATKVRGGDIRVKTHVVHEKADLCS